MKNFCYVKLNDVCELITDGTHQTPTYSDNGYIFLSSKNVTNGIIDWENIKYIPEELHKKLYERISPKIGDILLAKNGTTGIAALVDKNIIFDIYVSLALLRPKKNILPEYLLWAINNPYTKRKFQANLKGIGVPNLHLSYIKKTEIKFYDMPQQIYISNLMKKCKRIIDLKKQQLSELDKLVKFQFLKIFGDPVTNSKNQKLILLENCISKKSDLVDGPFGSSINTKVDYTDTGDIPVIRTKNVDFMTFNPKDLKFITKEKYEQIKRSQILPGDIILTKVGTIGNVCIFPNIFSEGVLSTTGSCRIRVAAHKINNIFLGYYLLYYKEKLLKIASTGVCSEPIFLDIYFNC